MFRFTSYADPFLGNGTIDLPKPYAPADSWHFIKGLTGNTSPGACLPFGKYSVLGYSGGYPCGCGINTLNGGGPIKPLFDDRKTRFIGMSHFHQSGTGAIGNYYNYALTSPFLGTAPDFTPRPVAEEIARPGYYASRIDGIFSEATVTKHAALHRYTLAAAGGIAIDFANDGLYANKGTLRGKAKGRVFSLSPTELCAEMTLKGIVLCFYAVCPESRGAFLFDETGKMLPTEDGTLEIDTDGSVRMGGGFFVDAGTSSIRMTVSTRGMDAAVAEGRAESTAFDDAAAAAEACWEEALSRVEIDCDDERERTIFYSNLYHTLVKPCDWTGGGYLAGYGDGPFVADLATLWDIYKTQLPFVFTLYPDISEKILACLKRLGETIGYFPHCLILSDNLSIEPKQARLLAEHAICDGYWRGVRADYPALLEYSLRDAERFMEDYDREKGCEIASHTLDMGEAFAALAKLARGLGKDAEAELLEKRAECFVLAFGPDGLMKEDSWYYEGNRFNYSFRPVAKKAQRLALAPHAALEREAERFFGFIDREDVSSRFEGFNNETDMESPYFLHELGRRDLLCRVITASMDCMYTTGRGGIPGNNDSGGMSSAYLWNVLGLFPLSGQDRMILGSPRFGRAVLHLPQADLTIEREGRGIYPVAASFNGRPLGDFELSVTESIRGGLLHFTMAESV